MIGEATGPPVHALPGAGATCCFPGNTKMLNIFQNISCDPLNEVEFYAECEFLPFYPSNFNCRLFCTFLWMQGTSDLPSVFFW